MNHSTYLITIASTLVLGAALLVESQPRLTILMNGSPAANITVTDLQTGSIRTTDATGSLTYDLDRSKQNGVFVPAKDGGACLVSFPPPGHMTVDFRGRYARTKTVVHYFGILPHVKITEQFHPTDAEIAAIEAGKVTIAEVQEPIRTEAEPSDATERRSQAF